ncbi:MAG: methionyl-tRNA formyltransferase [Alphaproteobacteria bacterium]|nr:methionyl-tRNA formyltransferase [Alphaproteobacteria bacterium]
MTPQTTRVAFMGTPDFAVHILEAILKEKYHIVAVFTQPPRPMGRGYKVTQSPVHKFAEEHDLPIFTPESLRIENIQNKWRNLDLDVAIVAAYGLILPKAILEVPRWGCINIHASLLPRWRGAAPIQRSILAGDNETGVTIMKMDKGLDTGDILFTKKVPINETTTAPFLQDLLAEKGAEALLTALPPYLEGTLKPYTQPEEGVTYAAKLQKKEGLLNWQLPATLLGQKVRALNPWPGTWFEVGTDQIKILESEVLPLSVSHPPGTVLDDHFTIACGEGALRPLWVKKIGRASLSAEEFLRGYELPPVLPIHVTL